MPFFGSKQLPNLLGAFSSLPVLFRVDHHRRELLSGRLEVITLYMEGNLHEYHCAVVLLYYFSYVACLLLCAEHGVDQVTGNGGDIVHGFGPFLV